MSDTDADIETYIEDKVNSTNKLRLKKKNKLLNYENIYNEYTSIDTLKMHKMNFIYNALEQGWIIKKIEKYYIFKKKHDNNEEIFLDSYLSDFINENCIIKNKH